VAPGGGGFERLMQRGLERGGKGRH
jgi:hypothetical protein